ncbi:MULTISPECIES: hypothetical protein [unclassified Pseudoxanthomonas]|uniref:hypothetical protein n=1 Tax=unclassified Pseudoxanthomonas TaxID=2645906 RepID=UPI00307E6769
MARLIWNADAWDEFKSAARNLYYKGLRRDELWKELEKALVPLYASADPKEHAQVYEDSLRYLIACGYLPASMSP